MQDGIVIEIEESQFPKSIVVEEADIPEAYSKIGEFFSSIYDEIVGEDIESYYKFERRIKGMNMDNSHSDIVHYILYNKQVVAAVFEVKINGKTRFDFFKNLENIVE